MAPSLISLDPAPQTERGEITIVVSEAGRSADGLTGIVVAMNGATKDSRRVRFADPEQRRSAAGAMAAATGLSTGDIESAFIELHPAVEGQLRLAEANRRRPATGKRPQGTQNVADCSVVADVAAPWRDRENTQIIPGDSLLAELHDFTGRFVSYPSDDAHVAHLLWIVHAHLMDSWECTPRLAFLSPEPASGKTRALEITELQVPNPVEAVNVTPAYLFRKVASQEGRPTILYDEIDTIFGPKAKDNEEIRGLLNAGHRIGAVAGRCVVRGKEIFTEEIPAYCAVALAGLGSLPDTILSRSVIIKMRRRAPGEHVEPYRRRVHAEAGYALRDKIAAWAMSVAESAKVAWPEMPAGIQDRDADLWEPLLVVADLAGGDWPNRARVAAVTLVADSKQNTPSLGIRLLSDLRGIFRESGSLSTETLIVKLLALDEAPWGELGGKPLNSRSLARFLAPYGVKSKNVRTATGVAKGYTREDLQDAFARYLPTNDDASLSHHGSATSATTLQSATPDDSEVI